MSTTTTKTTTVNLPHLLAHARKQKVCSQAQFQSLG